jgi:F0F1-type ATP synthase assembly protein I
VAYLVFKKMNPEDNSLKNQKEQYRTKAFYLMIEIGFIIALPAVAGFFLGEYFDDMFGKDTYYTIILLILSFIISWAIIIRKYVKFSNHVKKVDEKIREEKINKQ